MHTRFEQRSFDPEACGRLAQAGILPALARVLAARGITGPEDLRQNWGALLPPPALEGTREAAGILAEAAEKHRRIVVVADYDCDGATACAVAVRGLAMLGIPAHWFVPDRFTTGYGLSPEVVRLVRDQYPDVGLLVTVDNGVASVEGVKAAKEHGIDVLVTDHHLPGDTLPEAACIVNPNLPGSAFASKSLAGCGVMFYVLLALRQLLRERGRFTVETQPNLAGLADLVALGTVADLVPLDRNNRVLVAQGLSRIRRGLACPGIRALFAAAGRDWGKASSSDFAFALGPRINAAGRLAGMDVGIQCLLSDSDEAAQELAQRLDDLNAQRRSLEDEMQLDAEMIVSGMDLAGRCAITLFDDPWHQGVVGLVASRVKERVHRPVIAFAKDGEEFLKGSGRSIAGIHLRDALDLVSKRDPSVIVRFGGHAMAAGLTIPREKLERFSELFDQAVRETAPAGAFDRVVMTDGPLAPPELSFELAEALASGIWGQGFERPLFADEFRVLSQRVLKGAHLRLLLETQGARADAIFFRRSEPLPEKVLLAYRPEINEWQGRRSLQLVVEAAQESES